MVLVNILFITIIIFNKVGKLQPRAPNCPPTDGTWCNVIFVFLCWPFIFHAIFAKKRFRRKSITFASKMTPEREKKEKWKMNTMIKSKLPVPKHILYAWSCNQCFGWFLCALFSIMRIKIGIFIVGTSNKLRYHYWPLPMVLSIFL